MFSSQLDSYDTLSAFLLTSEWTCQISNVTKYTGPGKRCIEFEILETESSVATLDSVSKSSNSIHRFPGPEYFRVTFDIGTSLAILDIFCCYWTSSLGWNIFGLNLPKPNIYMYIVYWNVIKEWNVHIFRCDLSSGHWARCNCNCITASLSWTLRRHIWKPTVEKSHIFRSDLS